MNLPPIIIAEADNALLAKLISLRNSGQLSARSIQRAVYERWNLDRANSRHRDFSGALTESLSKRYLGESPYFGSFSDQAGGPGLFEGVGEAIFDAVKQPANDLGQELKSRENFFKAAVLAVALAAVFKPKINITKK
jgi:hypothetical protein